MSATEVWETPFSRAAFPSVSLIMEADGASTATVIVAPGGLDRYPKYRVRFTSVYAVTCEEEAESPTNFSQPREGHYAYRWPDSPYIKSYSTLLPDFAFRGGSGELEHYVFLGGDNIVSVVSGDQPAIDQIESPTTISVLYAV